MKMARLAISSVACCLMAVSGTLDQNRAAAARSKRRPPYQRFETPARLPSQPPPAHHLCCRPRPLPAPRPYPTRAAAPPRRPPQFSAACTAIGVSLEDASEGGKAYSSWVDIVLISAGGVSALCAAATVLIQVGARGGATKRRAEGLGERPARAAVLRLAARCGGQGAAPSRPRPAPLASCRALPRQPLREGASPVCALAHDHAPTAPTAPAPRPAGGPLLTMLRLLLWRPHSHGDNLRRHALRCGAGGQCSDADVLDRWAAAAGKVPVCAAHPSASLP